MAPTRALSGDLPQDEGTIDAPIGRHVRDRKRMSLHSHAARPAVTHFRVLARAPGFTLTRVRLQTGRTHRSACIRRSRVPGSRGCEYAGSRPEGLGRQFLHAASLAFAHPEDGRREFFEPSAARPLRFLEAHGLPSQPRV